jgi:hypothetical protein
MPKRPDDDTENCSSCRHWREDTDPGDTRTGWCKAGPPTVLYCPDSGLFAAWPPTDHDEDCGAYRRKVQ